MKWRNSKERELIAQGGCREQTLPTKNNPNPDLSDPQQRPQQQPPNTVHPPNSAASNHLEAMAKTRLAFNETLWTLPPPLHQQSKQKYSRKVTKKPNLMKLSLVSYLKEFLFGEKSTLCSLKPCTFNF